MGFGGGFPRPPAAAPLPGRIPASRRGDSGSGKTCPGKGGGSMVQLDLQVVLPTSVVLAILGLAVELWLRRKPR